MTPKVVYQTNPLGLYVGQAFADPSPIEPDVYLIPAGCVEVPPPATVENKVAVWSGGKWQLVDFYQGVTAYSITTGEPLTLDGFQPLPNGYTLKKPEPNQVWKDGEWVDDDGAILAALYQEKLLKIGADCSRYIEGGFSSDALGWTFRYASELDDQINLTGMILSGLDSGYACIDEHQVKAFRPHTAVQLHEVGQALVRFKYAALQHADTLKQALAVALKDEDLAAMKAITWTPPA